MSLPPIHRQVVVPAPPETAFRLFADHLDGPVLMSQPPRSVLVRRPDASTATISFAPVGDSAALVTVSQSRTDSWRPLGAFAAAVAGPFTGDDAVVIVLRHNAAPGVGDPFQHPLFGAHAGFLAGLREQGILVGAGPFGGTGDGMAIVRVAGPAVAAEVVRAAHADDQSVTGGLLEVQARSWVVMMHGSSLA
jgi:uncharacterized protein YciI